MLLRVADTLYHAHFKHGQEMHAGVSTRWKRATSCCLHEGSCMGNERPCRALKVYTGWARCSKLDNFERKVGHKLAFKRAVEQLTKDRSLRGKLWEEYFRSLKQT